MNIYCTLNYKFNWYKMRKILITEHSILIGVNFLRKFFVDLLYMFVFHLIKIKVIYNYFYILFISLIQKSQFPSGNWLFLLAHYVCFFNGIGPPLWTAFHSRAIDFSLIFLLRLQFGFLLDRSLFHQGNDDV